MIYQFLEVNERAWAKKATSLEPAAMLHPQWKSTVTMAVELSSYSGGCIRKAQYVTLYRYILRRRDRLFLSRGIP